jgi:hypothetical protein
MKKVLILFLLPLCFIACKNGSTPSTDSAAKDSVTATPTPPLPYTASYSSNFVPGKASDVATTLENYRAWQANDMNAMRATLGDSIRMEFSSGYVFDGTVDSMMKMAAKFRDSLSKVDFTFYAWTSNHSVDKNEDWVNIWYKEIDTYKTGKVDSAEYEDDNLLKNGKIAYSSSHVKKLKKK